ncbi:hypothetical protein Acr_07g0005080 [Actinidia rufa]|uniref:Uncharacterized protein n=1 Tax=Actinidia rufa TaxID=165716 RepID=A0A7J0EV09_9ERIC|nr:hypothetical protein Acr_07g0005080 [Actinidia rufa]
MHFQTEVPAPSHLGALLPLTGVRCKVRRFASRRDSISPPLCAQLERSPSRISSERDSFRRRRACRCASTLSLSSELLYGHSALVAPSRVWPDFRTYPKASPCAPVPLWILQVHPSGTPALALRASVQRLLLSSIHLANTTGPMSDSSSPVWTFSSVVAEQTSEFQRATGRGQKKRPEKRSQEGGHRGGTRRIVQGTKAQDQSSEAATTAMMAVDESDVLLAASADEESDWISDSGIAYHLCRDKRGVLYTCSMRGTFVRIANDAIVGKGQSRSDEALKLVEEHSEFPRETGEAAGEGRLEAIPTEGECPDRRAAVRHRSSGISKMNGRKKQPLTQRHAKQAQEYLMDYLKDPQWNRSQRCFGTCGSLARHEKVQPMQNAIKKLRGERQSRCTTTARRRRNESLSLRYVMVISLVVQPRERDGITTTCKATYFAAHPVLGHNNWYQSLPSVWKCIHFGGKWSCPLKGVTYLGYCLTDLTGELDQKLSDFDRKALSEFSRHSGFIREVGKPRMRNEMNRKTIGQIRQCIGHEHDEMSAHGCGQVEGDVPGEVISENKVLVRGLCLKLQRGTTVAEQTSEFQRAQEEVKKRRGQREVSRKVTGSGKEEGQKNCPRTSTRSVFEAATTTMMAVDESDVLLAASANEESVGFLIQELLTTCAETKMFSTHVACEDLFGLLTTRLLAGQPVPHGRREIHEGDRGGNRSSMGPIGCLRNSSSAKRSVTLFLIPLEGLTKLGMKLETPVTTMSYPSARNEQRARGGRNCKRRWRRSSPSSMANASKMDGMGVVLTSECEEPQILVQPHKKLIGMLTVKTASCDPPFSGELAKGLILGKFLPSRLHPDLPLPPRKRRTERDQAAKFFPFNSSQVIRAPGVCWDREKSGRGGGGGTTTFSTLSTSEPDMMEPGKGRQQQERLPQGKRQAAGLVKKSRGAGEPRKVCGVEALKSFSRHFISPYQPSIHKGTVEELERRVSTLRERLKGAEAELERLRKGKQKA